MAQVVSIVIKGGREKVEEEVEVEQEEQQEEKKEEVKCTDPDCFTHDSTGNAGVGLALTSMIHTQQLEGRLNCVKRHVEILDVRRKRDAIDRDTGRWLIWTGFLYLAAGVYFL